MRSVTSPMMEASVVEDEPCALAMASWMTPTAELPMMLRASASTCCWAMVRPKTNPAIAVTKTTSGDRDRRE